MYVCMYACMYACMHECMYACICIYIYMYNVAFVHSFILSFISFMHSFVYFVCVFELRPKQTIICTCDVRPGPNTSMFSVCFVIQDLCVQVKQAIVRSSQTSHYVYCVCVCVCVFAFETKSTYVHLGFCIQDNKVSRLYHLLSSWIN